jgi:peroxiredoxin Q/BCP
VTSNGDEAAGAGRPGVGDIAPDFTAATDTGASLTLSSLRGKKVVLYFYPKDDTPG